MEVTNPVRAPISEEPGQGNALPGSSQPSNAPALAVDALPEGVPRYLKNTLKRKDAPAGVIKKKSKKKKTPAAEQVNVGTALPISVQDLCTSVTGVDLGVDHAGDIPTNSDPQHEAGTISPALCGDAVPPPSSSAGGDILLLESPRVTSIWENAVIPGEMRRFIDPPQHFGDCTPLRDAEVADLKKLEVNAIRAASLVNKYSQLKLNASKLALDLASSREAQAKTEEDLRVSAEACAKLTTDFADATSSLTQANATLETTRADLQKTQGDLKTSQDDLATLRAELLGVQGDLNLSAESLASLRKDHDLLVEAKSAVDEQLKQSLARTEELSADLVTSVKDAFDNCISQIRFLNPGVHLTLTGVHHNAYVYNNQLVLAEPEASASTFANEEAGEEEDEEEEVGQP